MFRSLQSIQFHYLSLSIPADHHLPRTDRTPIFNLSRDRRMVTKSIKDSCQDGLTLIGIIERNSFRLCPTPPQKNAPLFPPLSIKVGRDKRRRRKRRFSLKKFVSSLKEDVTRLEKLELLPRVPGGMRFSVDQAGGGIEGIEASGISRVWRAVPRGYRGGEGEDRWPASGRAVGLPLTVASFIHCGGSRCAAWRLREQSLYTP